MQSSRWRRMRALRHRMFERSTLHASPSVSPVLFFILSIPAFFAMNHPVAKRGSSA